MSKTRNPNGIGSYKRRKDGRCQWTQEIDGKYRYAYANSPKELKEKVDKIADKPLVTNKLKVDDWFSKWLSVYIEPLKKTATYNQYSGLYKSHIKNKIGHRKITGISSADIQGVIADMNMAALSTWTMKHVRKIMHIAFEKAYSNKLIATNPVVGIEIPNKQAKTRKTLAVTELSALFDAAHNSRWIWSIKFMLVTGVRRGELLALKWSNVDFDNKRLTIENSNSDTGIGDTKSSKVHYVPLSDNAIRYLNEQKTMLLKEFNPILHNKDKGKSDLIFPNKSGDMLKPRSYYTMLVRFSKKAGIKATPHCLRHTFVYLTRDAITLKEIQAALGHDKSTTTLDIYGDILNDSVIATANKIDDVFNKVTEEIKKIYNKDAEKANIINMADYRKTV